MTIETGILEKAIKTMALEGDLHRYIYAHRLEGRPDLKTAIVVFIGKNKFVIKSLPLTVVSSVRGCIAG
jgi:hypothetical protein